MTIEWKGMQVYYKDRRLGFVNYNNDFVAPRTMAHYFLKFTGWGLNEELINDLLDKGIQRTVVMVDLKNGRKKLLICTTDTWLMKGKKYVNTKDGTEELQLVLAESQFDKKMENVE